MQAHIKRKISADSSRFKFIVHLDGNNIFPVNGVRLSIIY